ncbi:hypothetical protein A4Z71_00470 [Candidatus Rhodoluna planktonica]|uniref:Fibronectin type-III domain-containing protein n=2 Tax=Candidatus Rhodoluna planktonica TaxID=535712 RepID=A0A1D9DXK4_9MICO|nr:hypothetical protein A4Z71_00470 [Candidatus Rhodoluna planktonica]
MSKITVEFSAKFPDTGCAAQNSGSMVFGLGGSQGFAYYNIYRHSNFIGFNTFNSDVYGVAVPDRTNFHSYKFVMVPSPSKASNLQEIWIDGVKQNPSYQNTTVAVGSAGVDQCSLISGTGETSSERKFTRNAYNNGDFMLMTHPLNPNTWGTTGEIQNLKVTTEVTTATVVAPDAPTIGSIAAGDGQLSVPFTAPANNGGATISNYKYSVDGGGTWVSAGSTSSPIVITGLTNGTSYSVKLLAVNTAGDGSASGSVSASPVQSQSQSPNYAPPPAPAPKPLAPPVQIESVAITKAKGLKGSLVKLKLDAQPSENVDSSVEVKFIDLKGKLIRTLTIPLTPDTSVLEVPINLSVGDFTVEAVSLNEAGATSSPVVTLPTYLQRPFFTVIPGKSQPVLSGRKFSEPVYFLPDSAKLTASAKVRLLGVIARTNQSGVRIAVTGFTASFNQGSKVEQKLAADRALEVAKFLKANGAKTWIYHAGFGALSGTQSFKTARKVELRILD